MASTLLPDGRRMQTMRNGRVRRASRFEKPERNARVVRMYVHENRSLREIAQEIGCSTTNVRILLMRAGVPRRVHTAKKGDAWFLRRIRALEAENAQLRAALGAGEAN